MPEQYVYSIGVGAQSNMLFESPALVIQSAKVTWSKVATVVPNSMLTAFTVLWNDKRKKPTSYQIERKLIYQTW